MIISELKASIKESVNSIIQDVEPVDDIRFFAPIGEKWSVAENILHLTQSVKSLNSALSLPKEALLGQFGKIDRPLMSYPEVVSTYLAVLATGLKARGVFVPQMPENPDKTLLINSFVKHHDILINYLDNWTEAELDDYAIRHPVLKHLSLREMYYFMHYHLGHHQKAILKGI